LRVFVFFPASILTILGGLVFGVFWGSVWTLIGANLSVALAYYTGGFFLRESSEKLLDSSKTPASLKKLLNKAKSDPFITSILMRLLYLPFDLVSYLAGIVRLSFWQFLAGSAICAAAVLWDGVGFQSLFIRLLRGTIPGPVRPLRVVIAFENVELVL